MCYKTKPNQTKYIYILSHAKSNQNPWIGLVGRVFANWLGDQTIPGRVIQKTQKMVFDAVLLNTQHYKMDQG